MIDKQVKISEIKLNPANPRVIRDEKYTKLLNSLLVFPKMLQARPIVVDKQMVVLGGNMRLKALQEIATFDNDELFARLQKINEWKEKDKSEQTEIFDFWLDFTTTKKLNVAIADDFTDKEASAFIIKDNNNFGEWDYELLNNWDSELLEDWGVDADFEIEEEEQEETQNTYTTKIDIPQYQMTGVQPNIKELVDCTRTNELIEKIKKSNVSQEQKSFLIDAARRHNVFNYAKIAEYYAHQNEEMQNLMEQSALVIIDFNDAIKNGYLNLSNEIQNMYLEDE